jgi:D-apionolactonase
LLAFPLNPQMHAMDDLSIVENLESHADTVRTARSFAAAGTHLSIGPVTFHRRPDPFAAGKSGEEAEKVFPDARQKSGLAAAWTIGSIAALSRAGADSVTYYQAIGPFGILDGDRPGLLAEILTAVLAMDNAEVIESTVSRPLQASTLAIQSGGKTRLIVGNLLDTPQQFELGFDIPSGAQCRRFDGSRTTTETIGGRSAHADLHLQAYECMVIDWEGALS